MRTDALVSTGAAGKVFLLLRHLQGSLGGFRTPDKPSIKSMLAIDMSKLQQFEMNKIPSTLSFTGYATLRIAPAVSRVTGDALWCGYPMGWGQVVRDWVRWGYPAHLHEV